MSCVVKALLRRSILIRRSKLQYFTADQLSRRPIMTTPAARAEEAVDALKGNPYFEKYAKKIADLQKTSPEELLSRLKSFEESKEKKQKNELDKERNFSSAMEAKPGHVSGFTKPKLLSDIMKTELIQDKTAEEIQQIWQDYHKSRDVIVGIIPEEMYNKIYERSLSHPTFLLALPRSEGYEFIVCQFAANEIHFTPLISYQTHKENAPECLTMTHYTDLKDDKHIVLMKGEFNKDVLNVTEAQCLANQVQLYYGQDDKRRLEILERFTNKPMEFKHMDLIAELECLSI